MNCVHWGILLSRDVIEHENFARRVPNTDFSKQQPTNFEYDNRKL